MNLADAALVLDAIAPLRYAESWDNVGLLVGDPAAPVRRVLVTVDYAPAVAVEARDLDADLVVAYHPPIFAAVKRVPHEALWADAVRRGIALYAPHTALDVAPGGTNDFLADACGVSPERRAIRPACPDAASTRGRVQPVLDPTIGLGRIGSVERTTLAALCDRVKASLGLAYVLVAGAPDAVVETAAVAAGAGGELLGDALRAGADVFVTGEVRHHDALAAVAKGASVIATLHSNSERAAVGAYAARIAERLPGVTVTTSRHDADPFVIA
jgi:dinuclear metal center YbgI/SA1388 family protein